MTAPGDPTDITFGYGLKALAQAKRYKTSIEPVAYEVWYEHVAGHHRKLSADVRARIARGTLTSADLRELHASHLSSLRVSDRIEEIGSDAQTELTGLIATIRSALGELAGLDAGLKETAERMSRPGLGGRELADMIELAVATTRKVCGANQALQERLGDSQASIASLRSELETSRGEAMTDGLTELFNRRAFDEQLRTRIARARSEPLPLSLLMFDIDHFKSFNDRHGHPIGDQVIRLVASCIRQLLDPTDLPARYGGEEFAVICLGRPLADAYGLAEGIRRRIDGYEIVQQGTQRSLGKVGVSVGVAELRLDDDEASLIARADQCLYQAKRAGRNRVETDGPLRPEPSLALAPAA